MEAKATQAMATYYVTKNALTTGVEEYPGHPWESDSRFLVCYHKDWLNGKCLFGAKDWHKTRAEADQQVKAMATAKMRSLRKQLKKLQELVDATTSETQPNAETTLKRSAPPCQRRGGAYRRPYLGCGGGSL